MPTTRPPLLAAFMSTRAGILSRCRDALVIAAAVVALTAGACSVDSAYPRDQNWGSPIGHVDAAADGGATPDADAPEDVTGADDAGAAMDGANATDAAEDDAGAGPDAASAAADAPTAEAGDASGTDASDQAAAPLAAGT